MKLSNVWSARSFLAECFSSTVDYLTTPTWRVEADKLKTSITENVKVTTAAAKAATDLLPARALNISGGMTALLGATAKARKLAADAEIAAKATGTDTTSLRELLTDNNADLNELVPVKGQLRAAFDAQASCKTALKNLTDATAPSEQWHTLAARLNGPLLARLEGAKAIPGAPSTDELFKTHAKLCEDLKKSAIPGGWDANLVTTTVQEVTNAANQLEIEIGKLEAQTGGEPDAKLVAQRRAAVIRFDKTVEGYDLEGVVKTAIDKLRVDEPRVEPRHLTGAVGNQAAIRNQLIAALEKCTTPADIGTQLALALKRARDSVGELAGRLQDDTEFASIRDDSNAAIARELNAGRFEKMKPEVEEKLNALRASASPEYLNFKKRYDEVVKDTYDKQTYQVAVDTTLPDMIEEILEAFNDRLDATKSQVEALENRVKTLRQQLAQVEKRKDIKGAESIIAMIHANLDEAANFANCSGNLEAAEPATAILDDVELMLKDFTATSSEFAKLTKTLSDIESGLTDADLALIPALDLAGLTQRLTQLKDPKNGLSSTAFKAEIGALKSDLDQQTVFVGELKAWRLQATGELNSVDTQFQSFAGAVKKAPPTAFPSGKPDPSVGLIKTALDDLRARIAAPVAMGDFVDAKSKWSTDKTEAQKSLDLVWDSGTKTLKDTAAISKDAEAGMAKAEQVRLVTERCTKLTKDAKGMRAGIAQMMGNMGTFEVLTKQLAALPDSIAADPGKAATILDDIEKRLKLLPGTPDFNEAILRKVGEIPTQWKKVLALTIKNLDTLQQSIETTVTIPPFKDNLGELVPLFTKAKHAFPAEAFTTIADVLTQPDPNRDKTDAKRAKREEGLRLVRQYQAQLLEDPLFLHLQRNPFGVALFGELFRFLDRVELEFLRVAT